MKNQSSTEQSFYRSPSLDAFRGLAIFLMVLSGSIAFGGVLPVWMYHAQVPPPSHSFNPELPGITWVDLVFPFFLFAMGMAFPLSLGTKIKNGLHVKVFTDVIFRFILLVFFAIFTKHARAWEMKSDFGILENLLSICCFFLLFLMLSKTVFESKRVALIRKLIGFGLAISFLVFYPFKNKGFDFFNSDIIIIVLANMALFGSVIWVFTREKHWYRLAILPLIMGVFLSGKIDSGWVNKVYHWSPIPWAYTFYYLKYLFIVIPGSVAGDWIKKLNPTQAQQTTNNHMLLVILPLLMIVCNLIFLFTRFLELNLLISGILAALLLFIARNHQSSVLNNFLKAGLYLLFLGLCFEAYEGGIKKDSSTYSYYFVTSGLAFLLIYSFVKLEYYTAFKHFFRFFGDVGKNPMIAYTAGGLLLLPLMRMIAVEDFYNRLNNSQLGGFIKGLIFTFIVSLITIFFTRRKIFWKT